MQITNKEKVTRVLPTNRAAVVNAASQKLSATPFYHLLLLLAEGCDSNARDVNFYCTLGATKKGDALQLSITLDGERQVVYAASLSDIGVQAADIHDPL